MEEILTFKDIALFAGAVGLLTVLGFGVGSTIHNRKDNLYTGKTSLGETQIDNERRLLLNDPTTVTITDAGTTWTIYDNDGSGICNSDADYVAVETPRSKRTYRKNGYEEDGREYIRGNLVSDSLIEKSNELLNGRFTNMYNTALSEAQDSLLVRM